MSSPIQPSGMSLTGTTRVSASAAKRSATTTSLGQQQPAAALTGVAHRPSRDRLAALVLVPRRADREAVRHQEGEGHGAADQDRVGQLGEAVDDPDLVGNLDAADHDHERPVRAVQQVRERVQLGLQQQPRRRRQLLRDPHRGRVRAVHRPERVLHEQVGVGGQLGREAGIVAPPHGRRNAGSRACAARPAHRRRRSRDRAAPTAGRPPAAATAPAWAPPWAGPDVSTPPPARPRLAAARWSAWPRGCGCRRQRDRHPAARSGRSEPAHAGRRRPGRGRPSRDLVDQVHHPAGVAPLVVIPVRAP